MLAPVKHNPSWVSLIIATASMVDGSGPSLELGLKSPCEQFLTDGGVQCKAHDGTLVSWTQQDLIEAAFDGSWTYDSNADGYCPWVSDHDKREVKMSVTALPADDAQVSKREADKHDKQGGKKGDKKGDTGGQTLSQPQQKKGYVDPGVAAANNVSTYYTIKAGGIDDTTGKYKADITGVGAVYSPSGLKVPLPIANKKFHPDPDINQQWYAACNFYPPAGVSDCSCYLP